MKLKSLWTRVDHIAVAAVELTEARLQLLKAQTALEYASAMVSYHQTTITRLELLLNSTTSKSPSTTTQQKG